MPQCSRNIWQLARELWHNVESIFCSLKAITDADVEALIRDRSDHSALFLQWTVEYIFSSISDREGEQGVLYESLFRQLQFFNSVVSTDFFFYKHMPKIHEHEQIRSIL